MANSSEEIRILVADDEVEIGQLVKKYLQLEQYQVDLVTDGQAVLEQFAKHSYQLVILDVMMPKVDGIEACRQLRQQSNVPIMMLTAKGEELDKVLGLRMGADDYITKPFSIHELVARVKSQLRRFLVLGSEQNIDSEEVMRFGQLEIDCKRVLVQRNGVEVQLTAKEFELLRFMASHPDQVFTKNQLFSHVWRDDYLGDDNTVMVHIRRLRKKIETNPDNPSFIQTIWGIGYKFSSKGEC